MTSIFDAILDFLESSRGILQDFCVILPIVLELHWKFQLVLIYFKHTTNVFVEIDDSHFGRHLGFLGKLQGYSPGRLVCFSADFSGPILKI